jgi:type IV pilus assembly protein PilB
MAAKAKDFDKNEISKSQKSNKPNQKNDLLQIKLLNIFITKGFLTQAETNELIEKANKEGKNVIQVLRETGHLLPDDLALGLSEFYNLSYVKLKSLDLKIEIVSRLPEDISKKYNLIVLDVSGDNLYKIAISRPEDPAVAEIISFLKQKNNIDTELYIASETDIQDAFKVYQDKKSPLVKNLVKNPFSEPEKKQEEKAISDTENTSIAQPQVIQKSEEELQKDVGDIIIDQLVNDPINNVEDLKKITDTGAAPNILAALVKYASGLGASDIHIEPYEKVLKIRFRIDGVLRNIIDININLHPSIIARIKISSHLKIDEQRIPQDGRFDVKFGEKKIDIRVSTLPTNQGEKVVLRLLDKSKGIITVEELGLTDRGLKLLQKNIAKPYGMILATGPTGSGKTTTLYAILQKLNNPQVNIVTLEDPIEYQLEGVNHCQVRTDIGFDFANGLRSILRQDPNIIMVGEIRDKETAEMSIHAALTGHLLLSTLHTNNASGALPRLVDMGIEPFLISSTLNLVMAQRLVRTICPKCRQATEVSQELLTQLSEEIKGLPEEFQKKLNGKITFYKGKGCSECSEGYKGRIALFEVLEMDQKIQEAVLRKASAEEIESIAVKNGMLTLRQDGLIKALSGITTIDEVLRTSLREEGI